MNLPKSIQSMIICPGCGWHGGAADLSAFGICPECRYENSADDRLLTISELINDDNDATDEWDNVALGKFLFVFLRELERVGFKRDHVAVKHNEHVIERIRWRLSLGACNC